MAHGFTHDAIMNMTIAQVGAFLAAIERHERQRRLGDAIAARMAQADGKDWARYIRGLKDDRRP
jgi:hypothetical protein